MRFWRKKDRRESVIFFAVLIVHLGMLFINFTPEKKVDVRKQSIIVRTHVQVNPDLKVRAFSPKGRSEGKKSKKTVSSSVRTVPSTFGGTAAPLLVPTPRFPLVKCKNLPVHLPQPIETLHIDTPLEKGEDTAYLCLMVQTLRKQLKLPREGEVKITMTVSKSGYVEKIRILYAKSEENSRYLERALASLRLPPFSGKFCEKERHTFTLTFRDEK